MDKKYPILLSERYPMDKKYPSMDIYVRWKEYRYNGWSAVKKNCGFFSGQVEDFVSG